MRRRWSAFIQHLFPFKISHDLLRPFPTRFLTSLSLSVAQSVEEICCVRRNTNACVCSCRTRTGGGKDPAGCRNSDSIPSKRRSTDRNCGLSINQCWDQARTGINTRLWCAREAKKTNYVIVTSTCARITASVKTGCLHLQVLQQGGAADIQRLLRYEYNAGSTGAKYWPWTPC